MTAKAKKAGLNKSEYVRSLIRGLLPREAPPAEFFPPMMKAINATGNRINQMAKKAHAIGYIDPALQKEIKEFNSLLIQIYDVFAMSEKIIYYDASKDQMKYQFRKEE